MTTLPFSQPGWLSAAMILLIVACVSPRGGWDVSALIERDANLAGERLGDMLPFPALDGDRIALVACRFATPEPLRVGVRGSQWPVQWGESAIAAMDRALPELTLELLRETRADPGVNPQIEIVMIEAIGGAGPSGLGDTLSECDVTPTAEGIVSMQGTTVSQSRRDVRGALVRAEIRIRRAQRNAKGLVQEATAEEWVGALMHEMAHALGFAGHAAVGDSILVRDESRIRAAGRRALAGEPIRAPNIEALYAIAPGERLGTRRVQTEGVTWLHAIEKLIQEKSALGQAPPRLLSSVGDHEARLVWRDLDGQQLGIRFPYWRRELQTGSAITLRPDRHTRERFTKTAKRTDELRLFVDRGVD